MRNHLKAGIITLTIIAAILPATGSQEFYYSTVELVARAAHVAHVRVEGSYRAEGTIQGLQDYSVRVLANFKGELPPMVMLRVVLTPGLEPLPDGAELLVILGARNTAGRYPLLSIQGSILRLYTANGEQKGRRMIAPLVTGFGEPRHLALDEFHRLIGGSRRGASQ